MQKPGKKILENRDPVCGMIIDQGEAKYKKVYGDSVYYFCSPGCERRFEEEAEKYSFAIPWESQVASTKMGVKFQVGNISAPASLKLAQ